MRGEEEKLIEQGCHLPESLVKGLLRAEGLQIKGRSFCQSLFLLSSPPPPFFIQQGFLEILSKGWRMKDKERKATHLRFPLFPLKAHRKGVGACVEWMRSFAAL